MPNIKLSTVLPASAERVWAEVMRPRLFLHVAGAYMRFDPVDPPQLPDQWAEGDYSLAMRAFGWIPLGGQVVKVEFPPTQGDERVLRDNGHGSFFPEWDHRITVTPIDEDSCRYSDEIEFTGRLPGPIAKRFVGDFFRSRQERLKRLVANDFSY